MIAAPPAVVGPEPPGKLGAIGRSLWDDVVSSYEFSDRASYETLYQGCAAADLAASLEEQIARDGLVLRTKAGLRDHPCIKHLIQARAFVCRTLARLGLDLEPLHPTRGRPPGS